MLLSGQYFSVIRQKGDVPILRKAERSDAAQLAILAEFTFRATFGGLNTADKMSIHCSSSYSEEAQAAEIADPEMLTLISEHEGRFVGFAQLRWKGAPACVVARLPVEIQRLYVSAEWHGRGLAHGLMNACVEEGLRKGADAIWLGVWEHNPRAIAFYRKSGFVEVGDHVFPLGRDPQRDIVMIRQLCISSS